MQELIVGSIPLVVPGLAMPGRCVDLDQDRCDRTAGVGVRCLSHALGA